MADLNKIQYKLKQNYGVHAKKEWIEEVLGQIDLKNKVNPRIL